jgi:hypothetical protein
MDQFDEILFEDGSAEIALVPPRKSRLSFLKGVQTGHLVG